MSSIKTPVPERAAPALHEIQRGMELRKCRKCGCMKDALDAAGRAFRNAEQLEIRELFSTIEGHQNAMERIAYDCIGCKKCWGADAIIQLANQFEEIGPSECCSDEDSSIQQEYVPAAANGQLANSWPPHRGECVDAKPTGSVAL